MLISQFPSCFHPVCVRGPVLAACHKDEKGLYGWRFFVSSGGTGLLAHLLPGFLLGCVWPTSARKRARVKAREMVEVRDKMRATEMHG